MAFDGSGADAQTGSDLLVAFTSSQKLCNFVLPTSQSLHKESIASHIRIFASIVDNDIICSRSEERFVVCQCRHGGDKISLSVRLQHITLGSGTQTGLDPFLAAMHGKHEDSSLRGYVTKLDHGIQAI